MSMNELEADEVYRQKYLKYKAKYIALAKTMEGGVPLNTIITEFITELPSLTVESITDYNNLLVKKFSDKAKVKLMPGKVYYGNFRTPKTQDTKKKSFFGKSEVNSSIGLTETNIEHISTFINSGADEDIKYDNLLKCIKILAQFTEQNKTNIGKRNEINAAYTVAVTKLIQDNSSKLEKYPIPNLDLTSLTTSPITAAQQLGAQQQPDASGTPQPPIAPGTPQQPVARRKSWTGKRI